MEPQVFTTIGLRELRDKVGSYKERGWRFVNICGSVVEGGVEVLYSFSNLGELENLRLVVTERDKVPSISDLYSNCFVFENETHDLYGITFTDISIDFGGTFYQVSVPTPMNPRSDGKVR